MYSIPPTSPIFSIDSLFWEKIILHLHFRDIYSFALTCKTLKQYLPCDFQSWAYFLKLDFAIPILVKEKQIWIPKRMVYILKRPSFLDITYRGDTKEETLISCYFSPVDLISSFCSYESQVFPKKIWGISEYLLGYREPYTLEGDCQAMDHFGNWYEAVLKDKWITFKTWDKKWGFPLLGNEAHVASPDAPFVSPWRDSISIGQQLEIKVGEKWYSFLVEALDANQKTVNGIYTNGNYQVMTKKNISIFSSQLAFQTHIIYKPYRDHVLHPKNYRATIARTKKSRMVQCRVQERQYQLSFA